MNTPKKTDPTTSRSVSSDFSQQSSLDASSARTTPDSLSARTTPDSLSARTTPDFTSGRTTPEDMFLDDSPDNSVESLEAIQRHCTMFKPPYDEEIVPCIKGVESITVHAGTWDPPALECHRKVEINLFGNDKDDPELAEYDDQAFMLQSADTLGYFPDLAQWQAILDELGDIEEVTVQSTKYNIVVARELIASFLHAFEYLGRNKPVEHDPCLFKTIALEILGEKFGNTDHAIKLWTNVFMGFNAIRVLLAEKIRCQEDGKISPVRQNIEHYLSLVRDFEKDVWRALPDHKKDHLRNAFAKNKNKNALDHLDMVESGSPYRNSRHERIGVSPLRDSPRSMLGIAEFPDLSAADENVERARYQILKRIQNRPKTAGSPQINDARKVYNSLMASKRRATKRRPKAISASKPKALKPKASKGISRK